ncbi:MAG: magnesium transporter [Pirellulaceae bacterium]|jgi:magnesium transporter|nr:magnesium transporter [Pirellulaceae bacterium]
MVNTLLLPELRELLTEQDTETLAAVLGDLHPASIAEFSEGLTVEETWQLLDHTSIDRQAEIFEFYPISKQVELVSGVGRDRMGRLIEVMSPDDRVDLLRRLDAEVVESLMPLVARAERQDIRMLLSFPEGSAGSVMTTEYATLPASVTVERAITLLRQQAPSRETIYYVYVVDDTQRLIGFLSLRDLILARSSAVVEDIMQRDVVTVRVDQDREEAARELARYDFLAIPVVDGQHRLVGIITHDDVIDVMMAEATEDALHMGGVTPIEENYLDAAFTTVWRRRALWLSALFVAELFTFTALASFEDAIQAIVALSLFVPLCISTGGNSGSQAATLITRALALGHVDTKAWFRVLRHELLMGLALGATLGAIAFVRAAMTPRAVLGNANPWMLALVISQSVAAICLWGTVVGSMLPLAFKRLGFDPGYASSPFVATFVDVTGIIIYFSIASLYLL